MSLSRCGREDGSLKPEINVVPLVDVSLVLLVIFMVTATFIKTSGLRLILPAASATISAAKQNDIVVEVDRQGAFALGGQRMSDQELGRQLGQLARDRGVDVQVNVRGDSRAEYGKIVRVLSLSRDAGFRRMVVATRVADRTDGGQR
ncbi:MAG: biopolymer transporter ExbD [Capsulimonadaceae bacterium]|nr:biopolymer transporter ExbD [Capsulimonadaceae bacterium]